MNLVSLLRPRGREDTQNGSDQVASGSEEKTWLRTLQFVELQMLAALVGVCEKYGLTYFISGGTYLGAIRHNGFIPWDDDIDVALPREHYERLLEVLAQEGDFEYDVVTHLNTDDYHYPWAQIRDTRVQVKLPDRPERPYQACWIDVFPLDGAPRPGVRQKLWKLKLLLVESIWGLARIDEASLAAEGRGLAKRTLMRIGSTLRTNKWLNPGRWTRRRVKAIRSERFSASGLCLNAVGSYKFKSIFDFEKVYGNGATYGFENLQVNGPFDYDFYLTQIYGDYLKLPENVVDTRHNVQLSPRRKYTLGYTQGTFDMFHKGHLRLIERAKSYCDFLVVGVNSDGLVSSYKNKIPVVSQSDRAAIVNALGCVDGVMITNTLDKVAVLDELPFQAIFIGDDWQDSERWQTTRRTLNELGVEVEFLAYTEGISSTALRPVAGDRVAE